MCNFTEDKMKKIKFIILTACILLMILGLVSCKNGEDETQPTTEYFTVTFDTQGGSEIDAVKVIQNGKISKPADPEKDGYVFDAWTYNSKEWSFDSDKVTENITLTAKWIDASTIYTTEALENGVKIVDVKREFETMTVPSVIGGRPVVAIGEEVFMETNTETTQKIVVAASVTSVGKSAFKDCVGVEIVIKGALTEVGEYVFYNCDTLSSISFGDGLKTVPPQAFSGCAALKELILPESLTTIDENAFEDCTSLAAIIMHGTTKTIADGAFLNASSLKAVYFYGTQADVDALEIADGNDKLVDIINSNLYFYAETKPTASGKYWHFNDDGKIRVW